VTTVQRAAPPYGAYAAIMSTFVGGVVLVDALSRRLHRSPPERTTLDLSVLALATFKASRTLAHDEVTSFLREPFVRGKPDDPSDEEPLKTGDMRQAVGELVTCSRCAGTWVAAGIAGVDVLAPRFGRLLGWSLALAALNDWLQAGFASLTAGANRLAEEGGS
jgi:Protein of unknown function (DUF1360)